MFHLPTDILRLIYEYDDTYREKYNDVMRCILFENPILNLKNNCVKKEIEKYNLDMSYIMDVISRRCTYIYDIGIKNVTITENVTLLCNSKCNNCTTILILLNNNKYIDILVLNDILEKIKNEGNQISFNNKWYFRQYKDEENCLSYYLHYYDRLIN